jgi:integrase/recombinase XerD
MTDKPISPLRRRMIEDMTVRHFAEKARTDYPSRQELRGLPRPLARYRQRRGPSSVSTAHDEDPCEPVDHRRDHRRTPVLFQSDARTRRSGQASDVGERAAQGSDRFEPGGVARLLTAAPGVKYKAALGVAYGAGLRVSEVVALKVSDIDNKRRLLRVEQGKGRKDRYVMLSPL